MKRKSFTPKGLVSRTGALASALAATLLILGTAGAAAAQDGAVAGQVTAETGETLQGVQVFIPGTSFGTLTDEAGRYRLTGVPAGEHTLRASIIGYRGSDQLATVTAGEVATVDFVLPVSAVALDEVVATITGERRRRELATDISTVDATTVQSETRSGDINSLIKGQASGVIVRQNNGAVGTGSDVRIRGTGSISLSNQPLYVIDGAIIASDNNANSPLTGGVGFGGQDFTRINDLNPDEIESIEIIKGPAASALWGARGNAGVIIITTKRGSTDTRFNARADLGFARNTEDFWPSVWNPLDDGFPTDTLYTQDLLAEFDPFRDALYQSYNMNVGGGAGIWNYFGSVQYNNEKGTLPNNAQEKFNFRANFNVDPSDKLNFSFSNGFASTEGTMPDNDNNAAGYLGVAIIGFAGDHPLTVPDPVTGEIVETCGWDIEQSKLFGLPTSDFDSCPDNSFFLGRTFEDVASLVNLKKVERYTGSGNVTWTPIGQNWINRFTLGYDVLSDRSTTLTPVDPDRPFGTGSLGDIIEPFTTSRNLTLQGTTSYLLDLSSNLGLEAIGGVQWFRTTQESIRVDGQVFPPTGPAVNNAVNNQATDGFNEQKSIGFFVQGQFDWKDRVFVNGSVRWDNNSAQGENLGVQTYPKFGASIVALEGHSFFNMLKFRGAWGKSGKLPGTNDAFGLVDIQQVSFEGGDELGFAPDRPGNPLLQPETGEELEVGVDMAFLRDRVGLVLTYYDQVTKNTVVSKNLAPSSGFPNAVFTNIGEIENKGFEVALDALVLDASKVSWDWRFIFSKNTNKITELVDPLIFGLGGSSQRQQQGLPFSSYVQEQVVIGADGEAKILTCDDTPGTWGPGDTPGDKEDFCNPLDDNRYNGQPNPVYEGSVQTTLTLFRYVTLFALLDFQTGFAAMNNNGDFTCGRDSCPDIYEKNSDGTFTDDAKVKRLAASIGSEGPFIVPGDWGKLRVVQARFDMPANVAKFFKLSGMSFSFIGENLAIFSGYADTSPTATDPEINFAGQDEASRSEFLTLPIPKRFIGTINLYF